MAIWDQGSGILRPCGALGPLVSWVVARSSCWPVKPAGPSNPRRSRAQTGRCIATTTREPATLRSRKSTRRTSRASAKSGRIACQGDSAEFPGDADRRQRLHVSAGRQPRGGARPRNRQRTLAHIVSDGAPSRRGVAYWPGDGWSASHHLHGGTPADRAGRRDRQPAGGFGKNGEVDIVVPVQLGAARLPERRRGWREQSARVRRRAGQRARVRCPKWRQALGIQLGGAAGQRRSRHLGRATAGKGASAPMPGRSTSRSTSNAGCLYLPLASPIPGGYGGDREGANLYGNSVVAVDVQTGAYKWHFQTIHHDCGMPIRPPHRASSTSCEMDGRVPAMALTTKSGYMYILNRETGQPIFGVEERAVPKSDVPGERTLSHAADSGQAAAARACRVPAGGSRERRRHDTGTCGRVPGRWSKKTVASTTRDHSRRGNIERRERQRRCLFGFPWRTRRPELGRNGVRSRRRDMSSSRRRTLARWALFETLARVPRSRTRKPRQDARPSMFRLAIRAGPARNRHGEASSR